MGGTDKARPAFVEEFDDELEETVRGTRRSARASRTEKPKVSHREREVRPEKHRRSHTDGQYALESTRIAQHIEVPKKERDMKLDRRMSSSRTSPRKNSTRPPSSHDNRSFPKLTIPSTKADPSHYGIPTPTGHTPTATARDIPQARPRAFTAQTYPRPLSYHGGATSGGYGPPIASSAYYHQQQTQAITPSFPPPSPNSSYMRYAATPQQYNAPTPGYITPQLQYTATPQYTITAPQTDYFQPQAVSRPLESRFGPQIQRTSSAIDPIPRTASAFQARDYAESDRYDDQEYYDDGYDRKQAIIPLRKERRGSIRVPSRTLSRAEKDTLAMPPPMSKGILRRPTLDYQVAPVSDPGTSTYHEERVYHAEPKYREKEYVMEYPAERERRKDRQEELRREEHRPRRPSKGRHSVSYDLGSLGRGMEGMTLEPESNTGRRRQSFYDKPSSAGVSSAYEDQVKQAQSYQNDVQGGAPTSLTAEALKKAQRGQGSTRSTKSSASRDESDYKKSATTYTTRSGSGNDDENVTIKVKGGARVMVEGAQIDCTEDGEIEIIRRQRSLRNGSERSNSVYGDPRAQIEDRKSRVSQARPTAGRTRRGSVSHVGQEQYTRNPQYPVDRYENENWM